VQTTSVTLGSLIDSALYELESAGDRARPVTIGGTALSTASEVDFTLGSGSLQVSDIVDACIVHSVLRILWTRPGAEQKDIASGMQSVTP